MRQKMKNSAALILFCWKSLMGFELIYKTASTVIFVPMLWNILNLTMTLSGYSYLTAENILPFCRKPVTLLALLILFVFGSVCAMIDISAIIFILDQARLHRTVHFWQILCFSAKNALRICQPKNILLGLVILLLIPYLGFGLASGFLTTISLPEFILDYIQKKPVLALLFGTVTILLTILMLRWIYVFHYFVLEHCTFREARKKSRRLCRKNILQDLAVFLLIQGCLYVFYLLSVVITSTVIVLMDGVLARFFLAKWLVSTSVWLILVVMTAVFAALALPAGYACVSVLYYYRKELRKEPILPVSVRFPKENPRRTRLIHHCNIAFGSLLIAGSLILGYLFASGTLNPQIEYIRTLEVTAHRGASAFYPENTMPAFEGAAELGADWIELDVQQTKDLQLIVTHDSNLKRVTGKNANVWNLTLEEIQALDAGSFFRKEYAGTRIPLLCEVLAYARDQNIRLNIELKPTGHEVDFEKSVIDLIREYEFEERCVVTSQSYRVLEHVKEYDDSIQTVYVMSMAYGHITRLTCADNFSVEATFVTNALVSTIHNEGKQLYAWTVNSKKGLQKMIDLNVDNIITDNITLARNVINESRTGNLLNEYLKLVASLF